MRFPDALVLIWGDKISVRRKIWRQKRRVHQIIPIHHPEALPYLEIITDEGRAPYVPAQCDMMANDWEMFEETIQ